MECVRASLDREAGFERAGEEGEVSEGVERLVTHGFVLEPEWAQRPVIAEDDSMLQAGAPSKPAPHENLGLRQQAERAGSQQLRVIRLASAPRLPPDGRVGEVDVA